MASNYEKLVKALRCRETEWGYYTKCEYYGEASDNRCVLCDSDRLAKDAAAAIEDLQAQLPKRGEWIIEGAYTYNLRELNGKAYEPVYRCSCCNRQTESYLRLDEPKMPEDADFPEYCPHCGAKMEAQDGQ